MSAARLHPAARRWARTAVMVANAMLAIPAAASAGSVETLSAAPAGTPTAIRLPPALRVATVGYRLAAAAAARCPAHTMLTGLVLHDRAAYDEITRTDLGNLGWGFGVRGVVAGSPADSAGMREGDEIIAVNGQDLRNYRRDLATSNGTFARTEAFTNLLAAALEAGPVRVRVLRAGDESTVLLSQQPGCLAAFTLTPGRTPAAWTDGHYVAVTDAMEHSASDDALAFAMAHELGHVILGHADVPDRPLAVIGIGAGHARKEETDADRFAVHLTYAAGYDPAGGEALFALLSAGGPLRSDAVHPSMRARTAAVKEEIAHLGERTASLPAR